MRFPSSLLDEIRARVPISEIVGARVRFDPKKSNMARGDYWACCPFHGEKTPSFHCDDRRGNYHCFGCGVSGDIFRFLTELDGLSFHEAVERLADRAGVPMPKPDTQTAKQAEIRAGLYDVLEQAARFFEKNLCISDMAEAATARAYLQRRGIGAAAQKQFRLGYAPSGGQALRGFLLQQNIDKTLLEQTGLFAIADNGGPPYDRFRDRIIFPITDIKGRVIAFGGRALKADVRAKYLNSPETELFHKGRIVYNLAQARQALYARGLREPKLEGGGSQQGNGAHETGNARGLAGGAHETGNVRGLAGGAHETGNVRGMNCMPENAPVIGEAAGAKRNAPVVGEAVGAKENALLVVEGYVDVVALAQAGIGSAVAPLGTALTEEQMTILWRYCPQPVLCFDGDKAGLQAAYRALDRALPLLKTGLSLQFVLLPEGQDPDDIIRSGGAGQFEELLAGAAPLADILWQREIQGRNFTTPESRAVLEKRLRDAASTIKDSGLRHYYLQDIKQRLWNHFRPAYSGRRQKGPGSRSGNLSGGGAFVGGNFSHNTGFGGGLITRSLADSSFVRSVRGESGKDNFAPREAAILALLAVYPVLWHENFDILAQLEFQNTGLKTFHSAMLEILAEAEISGRQLDTAAAMQSELEQKGQKPVLDKIAAFIANLGIKIAQNSISPAQARGALNQALTLYRRAHSLHKQIREIADDLLDNATSRDFARLLALREELRRTDDLDAAPDDI